MKVILVVVALATCGAVASQQDRFAEKQIASYPFVASPERATTITSYYKMVTSGMTADEVAVLGEPDEVRMLYAPKPKQGEQIGHTYWYVLRRAKKSGSVDDKDESLVRISFDIDGKVTHVDRW
jgi:hypothetical protein